jgi:hypothetical protein
MKSIIFFATIALSSTSSVFGAPTTTNTLLTSRVQHPHVTASNTTVTARATNSWVCFAFSLSTTNIGLGVGVDESSAALQAIGSCASSDCTVESSAGPECGQHGCIVVSRGVANTTGEFPAFPIFQAAAAGDEQQVVNGLATGSLNECIAHSEPGSCGDAVTFLCSDLS